MPKQTYQIVGTNFVEGGAARLANLMKGAALRLVREPNNPHDKNAVAVYAGSQRIGYVPRKNNVALAQFIDQVGEPVADVVELAMDSANLGSKTVEGTFVRSYTSGFPQIEVSE